jgi:hypothetical protein
MSEAVAISDIPTATTTSSSEETTGLTGVSNFGNSTFDATRDSLIANFSKWWRNQSASDRGNHLSSSNSLSVTPLSMPKSVGHIHDLYVAPPRMREIRKAATFSPLQEWEGCVTDVTKTHMIANLVDLSARNSGSDPANFQAEIPLEELSESDLVKAKPGRVFRWAIGYQRTPQGTKMRGSQFVFRDLPQWTGRELATASQEASELSRFFENNQAE